MKRLIIGTAGHIDHGKSALVKAMTGIDPDRLKEEKERGITIDLGFAFLDLPGVGKVGVIDVPGHERFVRNMVAGAFGIDILLMVIAADEGVMPQTREHLDICELLAVRRGIVVITKSDLVEKDFLDLVIEDVRAAVSATFLREAPIVPFSAVTLEGAEALKTEIVAVASRTGQRETSGALFMPIDRVFTMKGFGTVVTGTLLGGSIKKGDTIELLPDGSQAKVRGLQVYGEEVEEAAAGQRCAINLQGVEKASVSRGDAVSSPGALVPTSRLDCEFKLLANVKEPMRSRAKVLFHTGTSQTMGTVILLDRPELAPGESAYATITLDRPIVTLPIERFIARGFTTLENYGNTMGGGLILDPLPKGHRGRRRPDELGKLLDAAKQSDVGRLARGFARQAAAAGIKLGELERRIRASEERIRAAVLDLEKSGGLCMVDPEAVEVIERGVFDDLKSFVIEMLVQFHEREPLREGIPREELKSRLPQALSQKGFALLLRKLSTEGKINAEAETVRLSSHRVLLGSDIENLMRRIEAAYLKAGTEPPRNDEVASQLRADGRTVKDVLRILAEQGRIVRVSADLYFHADVISALRGRIIRHVKMHGQITTQEFKDMANASRKFVIPLLEHFDREKVTIRVGEARKLRGDSAD